MIVESPPANLQTDDAPNPAFFPLGNISLRVKLLFFALFSSFLIFLLICLHFRETIVLGLLEICRSLEQQHLSHPLITSLIIGLIFVSVQVFVFPFMAFLCIIVAVIYKNFLFAYSLSLLSSTIGSATVFLLVSRNRCSKSFDRYRSNEMISLVVEETHTSPLKIAILVRFLALPSGLKDYLLVLAQCAFYPYMLSALMSHGVFSLCSTLVGLGIQRFEFAIEGSRSWSQKSRAEKFSLVLLLCTSIFTLLVVFWVGVWARRKIRLRRLAREIARSRQEDSLDEKCDVSRNENRSI